MLAAIFLHTALMFHPEVVQHMWPRCGAAMAARQVTEMRAAAGVVPPPVAKAAVAASEPCDCALAYLQSETGWHAATLTVYYVHAGTDGSPWAPSLTCSFQAALAPGMRLLRAAAEDLELASCRDGDAGTPLEGRPTQCRWRVRRPSGNTEVFFVSCPLFTDGFESGDTSRWGP